MGWQPNKAPEGYSNHRDSVKGLSTIMTDEKRFPLLRKAFGMILTGIYTVPQVLNKLNNE